MQRHATPTPLSVPMEASGRSDDTEARTVPQLAAKLPAHHSSSDHEQDRRPDNTHQTAGGNRRPRRYPRLPIRFPQRAQHHSPSAAPHRTHKRGLQSTGMHRGGTPRRRQSLRQGLAPGPTTEDAPSRHLQGNCEAHSVLPPQEDLPSQAGRTAVHHEPQQACRKGDAKTAEFLAERRTNTIRAMKRKLTLTQTIKDIRRAKRKDIPKVEGLVTGRTVAFFGTFNVGDLITKAYISAIMEDIGGHVVGCLCVNNYPNVPSIPPWYWKPWASQIYKMNRLSPRNSLWVHFAACDSRYTSVFLFKMLEYMYERCYYVKYIILVVPPNIKTLDWLESCGVFIYPHTCAGSPSKLQRLYLTTRCDFVTYYKIRRAVVQDNDVVTKLINQNARALQKIYGDYYIAELILESAHSDRNVIVAEHNGEAVAVMILNKVVNYEMVNNAYKLETFYGLRKPHPADMHKVTEPEHAPPEEDTFSLVSVPEKLDARSTQWEDRSGVFETTSDISRSTEDDFELPTDVAADLEIIISNVDFEKSDSYDDSASFLGTLEDQVTCAILSYTAEQFDKWKEKKTGFPRSAVLTGEPQVFHPKIPVYHGEGNAFAIEVIAAKPEHEAALRFLLEAAYECYLGKDYCVLCLPSTETPFSLLKLMVRVTPRPSSNFENEMYVAHKSAVNCKLRVREATKNDIDTLDSFLGKLRTMEMHQHFISSVTDLDSPYTTYILFSYNSIVGFAILSDQDDIDYIHSHYQLNTWTDVARHKELHRLSDYTILFYKIYPQDVDYNRRRIACALGMLLPVVPSTVAEIESTGNEYWKLPDVMCRRQDPYALYISTPLHCGLSRTEINTKIVVVGASDVALSFLVELIFRNNPSYRVTFNNITLVSPHGVCRQRTNKVRDILIPSRSILHGFYLSQLSLRSYVNVVNGVMTEINRKQKTITLNNNYLPYDLLFLTCGIQYQIPQRFGKYKRIEFPDNVFIVNSEIDADIALTKLNRIVNDSDDPKYKVIVYGHDIEAFSCIAALLEFGIPSQNLVFVYPTPIDDEVYNHPLVFDDNDVEDAVFTEIKELGVQVHIGFHFINWSFDEENNGINSVMFESRHQLQEIECIGMFAYCDKMVSMRTFLAINRAGLVFDGGLVVGPDCQTNDPNIYAAGSVTKYPRKYYADHRKHLYYNQEEIGRRLAQHIIVDVLHLQATVEETETLFRRCNDPNKMLVPQYNDPLVVYATLPGKLYYLNVRKPGIPVPQDVAMTADDYGQVLLSGNCKSLERQGYFRLHLNNANIVETITCLARFPIQRFNLSCLWGKHERLLNNLVQRFEMVQIPDLFEFFKEEWTYLIYHDHYKKLSQEINDIMISLAEEEDASLIEDIITKFDNCGWKTLSPEAQKMLKWNFVHSEYNGSIIERFLSLFADNMLYLPMYAHPLLISFILGGYEDSPYFKKM
ncbi:hypothetical protein Trydic_g14968 [Trypoxylus dichotomus]